MAGASAWRGEAYLGVSRNIGLCIHLEAERRHLRDTIGTMTTAGHGRVHRRALLRVERDVA